VEVVKTSEELEKQILEDARRKASRILENAEKECAAIRAEWENKLKVEGERIDGELEMKMTALREELAASLPLDFMRTRLSFIEETVRGKLREVFQGLSEEENADIITVLVKRIQPVFEGKTVVAYTGGIAAARAEKILKTIPGIAVKSMKSLPPEKGHGIILETSDGKIRFRGTFDELEKLLMEEHREELVEALLGKEI
jgi:V/A-type H+-transporting ATPase subunit E